MGIAVFIPDITFPETYERVTLTGNTYPSSIQIVAEDSYTDFEAFLSVDFYPINTSLRGIVWSVVSGGEYASIDSNGRLSINHNASSSTVVVKAACSSDSSIYATKQITVTYNNSVVLLEKVSISWNPTINTHTRLFDENDSIEMKYKLTDAIQSHNTMLWGCLKEESAAYLDYLRQINVTMGADQDHARPISSGEFHAYMSDTVIGAEYVDEFYLDHMVRNGESLPSTAPKVLGGFTPSSDIYILHPYYPYCVAGIDVCYFKFKRNGVVTHNFQAAEKNGVFGFYDSYSETFITNTGLDGTITGDLADIITV